MHSQLGDPVSPQILSFEATPEALFPRSTVTLVATFRGGEGRLEPGAVPIASGVPREVGPFASGMTFTLVVSDGAREVSRDLGLPFRHRGRLTSIAASPRARAGHATALLSDGRVLVAAGRRGAGTAETLADVWDPEHGSFTPAGEMLAARWGVTAVRLPDGRVAVGGGETNLLGGVNRQVEVWSPATGTWSELGTLLAPHDDGTISPIPVAGTPWLAAGGSSGSAGAELFHPATGEARRPAGEMLAVRGGHTATYLANAKVLLAGGVVGPAPGAELYDTVTERFEPTGAPAVASRFDHVAAYLAADAQVLLAGGFGLDGRSLASAELYDVESGTFAATGGLNVPRSGARAVVLASGEVLVAGGLTEDAEGNAVPTDTLELYDPGTGTFSLLAARLAAPVSEHTLTLLADGRVLVLGGSVAGGAAVGTAQIFD
jgi:hypothetical protein